MPQDKRLRFAIGVGLLEWLIIGALIVMGAKDSLPMVIGVMVIASLLQSIALFGRAKDNSPFGQAQRLFVAGRYADVVYQLANAKDVRSLTLAGNAYRQLVELDLSEQVLQAAVAQAPDDHFPLYGLGRTLLSQGNYAEAISYLEKSLDRGGRKATRIELALTYYLMGDVDAALKAAKQSSRLLQLEPYRALMVNYLLYQLAQDQAAPAMMQRASEGLAYWTNEATRFAETTYGKQLQIEVEQIKALL